jgi:hypothetical protein
MRGPATHDGLEFVPEGATAMPACSVLVLLFLGSIPRPPQEGEVPVTIKELDVAGAIREFQDFQQRLDSFRKVIGEGRAVARETAQILEELRRTAAPENDHNEAGILAAISGYVDSVIEKQVGLVDFLESQRYRISYYANRMASSVRPEDLALLFGTEEQNVAAIEVRVRAIEQAQSDLADFVDTLPEGQFDRKTFLPLPGLPRDTKKQLDNLLYRYQQERNALELGRKRLTLVRAAERATLDPGARSPDIDADVLVGQMFGALDRVRIQMSMDLMYLEQLLAGYTQSARTMEILEAFQDLVELQGDLEGPSPELSGILDWLQDSSTRRITLGAAALARPGLEVPRYSELLREAYRGARGDPEQ